MAKHRQSWRQRLYADHYYDIQRWIRTGRNILYRWFGGR